LRLITLLAAALIAIPLSTGLAAQSRTVALTIDDLPFAKANDARSRGPEDAKAATVANRKLLKALAHHKVPVTGFVVEQRAGDLGPVSGRKILQEWTQHGFDLGNHTFAHPDFDTRTVAEFEDQIIRGEATIFPLMRTAGRKVEFFRFPYNHTGDTEEKHAAVANFLTQHGYRLAPCTIETSDWMFNSAYVLMLARKDRASAARLRADYLAFTSAQIDYFQKLNKHVLGYEPPEIMLIHDNQLNADVIEKLLALFEQKQYHWVTLNQAEADPIYRAADGFVTKYGPMWGYRWARVRGVTFDGRLEPEPPKWIADYGKNEPIAPRRARGAF
jgi:peptidoglycan/xylan/chitin deacetylase (PgdA/CDA1 family)